MGKKSIYIGLAVIISFVVLFIGVVVVEIGGEKIAKNTYVNNINVGRLTKSQATSKLEEKYKLDNIKLSYLDKVWNIESKDIDLSYDINETVNNAYNLNRTESFIDNLNKTIKSHFGEKDHFKIILNYNEEKLKQQIEKIAKDIDVNVKDAQISINGSDITVEDETAGLKVNVDESLKNNIREIQKGNSKSQLVVTKIEPNVKKEYLKEVDTLLGTHTTKFDSSVKGRSTNIRLATSRTSDVLLMPGDTFSYNDHTGVRSVANGYKNAPVIVQGVVQEGVGGGVCQVSTTLYNAVLYSGLELVNIKNHSIPSNYAQKGRDATVTDGGIDFVFKNNLNYPVYVRNYVSGNTVTCQIYGSSKDKKNIRISTNVDGVAQAPIKKVEDPTLPKGEEKELEKARNGYTVSTYRVYKDADGKTIKTEKVAISYYPKKQGVIAVGTKEEVVPPTEEPSPELPPVQPPVQEPSPQPPAGETTTEIQF
ncbi:VanW family protein [Romboutsia sp.]|uniref:VanW family protein n=1 Tax=Romboutsia sp. TaxID=1965302 RepID=UPI003F37B660